MNRAASQREQIRARAAVLAVSLGRAPRRRPMPRQQQPDGIRLAYFGELLRVVVQPARAEVQRLVVPELEQLVDEASRARGDSIRNDAAGAHGRAAELMGKVRSLFNSALPAARLTGMARGYAHRTSDFQLQQLQTQLKAGLGVDPIIHDPHLEARVDAFTEENVALIKSVPSQYFDQVETVLQRDIREGLRAEDIANDLVERAGVAESRAKLIARDQVGKFYGELNRVRQQSIGLTGYTWQTMNDNRVRPEHEERQGESFEWDSPPEDGAPGDAVNCRCYAEPDLAPLLDDDDAGDPDDD